MPVAAHWAYESPCRQSLTPAGAHPLRLVRIHCKPPRGGDGEPLSQPDKKASRIRYGRCGVAPARRPLRKPGYSNFRVPHSTAGPLARKYRIARCAAPKKPVCAKKRRATPTAPAAPACFAARWTRLAVKRLATAVRRYGPACVLIYSAFSSLPKRARAKSSATKG